ncbi:AhpC/TSA family protein [Halobacteriovorax sp.]|uniref:AhpC/TSA family protein n=1 Tax=Halobacteriovorax sp. TaxID=2020862 RepID=UPI00356B4513
MTKPNELHEKKTRDLILQQKVNILTLKRLTVFNEAGEEVKFNTFLENKTITIIFVRHFGCISCRSHVDQIWNLQKLQKNPNNKIIFIGSGKPYVIQSFKEVMGVQDAEIYTDPSLATFDACGMNRGVINLVNTKSLSAMLALKKKGYEQGSFKDSGVHRQMGGVVIFKKPGQLAYHFASEHLGDVDDSKEWPV